MQRKPKSYRVQFAELEKAAARDTDAWHVLRHYNELRDTGVIEPEIRYNVGSGYNVRDPHALRRRGSI